MMHGIFISAPHIDGLVYVATRSRYGSSRFLWSVLPYAPTTMPDMRIAARAVPLVIRRQAYRRLGKLEQ
jgi:hypothetical protein